MTTKKTNATAEIIAVLVLGMLAGAMFATLILFSFNYNYALVQVKPFTSADSADIDVMVLQNYYRKPECFADLEKHMAVGPLKYPEFCINLYPINH